MEVNIINGKESRTPTDSTSSDITDDSKRKFTEKCQYRYNHCSHMITNVLEEISYSVGSIIGKYPWSTILATLIIFIAMSCGLLMKKVSTDDEFLWTPYGSDFVEQNEWIKENYPKDKRYESILVYTKDGISGNVLTAASIQYLNNVHGSVENLTSSDNKTFSDLCLPIVPPSPLHPLPHCSIISILGIFNDIDNLSDQDVLNTVTEAFGKPSEAAFISNLLAGVTWDSGHENVISASAFMTTWILMMPEEDSYTDEGGSYVDPIAKNWETEFIDLLATDEGYIKGGNENTNGESVTDKPDYIQVEIFAERSFDDGIDDVLKTNTLVLYAGGVILLIFIMLVLGRFNSVDQRVVLSLCGMLVIGLGLLASIGFCFYTGWFWADMHPIIPFLLLGIGVDDMFVIVKSMDNLSVEDKRLPAHERIALTLRYAGVSITVTSITNMFAFLIGATSSMPIVRSFCIFCGMGIFFLYLFSVTFFVACMALDEKRIDARKPINCPCIASKPEDWKPSRLNDIRIGKYIFEEMLPKLVFNLPAKVIVIIVTLALFGAGLYGVTQIESEYDPVIYMDARSYQRRYFDSLEKYFPEAGERVEIYIGDIEYWKFDKELQSIQSEISTNPSIRNNSLNYWYPLFHEKCCSESSPSCTDEMGFKIQLGGFLTGNRSICGTIVSSGPMYLNNMKLVYEKYPDDLRDGNFNITATRATFQHNYLNNTPAQNEAVKSVKDSLASIRFEDQSFQSPIAYAFMYVQWEANEIIGKQLTRNLCLTFVMVIILTLLFVPNIQVSIPTLACVSFTVLDLFGFCYYLGFSIEFVTTIIIILSVGLAIDYCVHISIAYMCYTEGSREEKAKRALGEMGGAVFNGAFSTFLAFVMLSTSRSYVYKTFFEMFALVLLFGLFHGLIFLPVLLSLIGPQSPGTSKQFKNDLPDNGKLNLNPYDNKAFQQMEKGSVNGYNSKITQL